MAISGHATAFRMSATYPLTQAPVVKTDVALAGFWRRVLALLIDEVFLFGVGIGLYEAVTVLTQTQAIEGLNVQTIKEVGPVMSAISWAYFGILESSPARGTLGKIALGLYVGDKSGDQIGFRRAVWRNWLKNVSWLPLGAGFVLAGITPRKQALHDVIAGTLVLRKVHYFEVGPHPPTDPGDHWDGTRWIASVPPTERS